MNLYPTLKRALDVTVAAGVSVVAAPIVVTAVVAIRTTMGSPAVFRQERPGLHGRPFELYKLRTMTAACEGDRPGDSDGGRLTGLGRFLRATSIDELPQLWNVLRGDMSLVGPRPLMMQYLDRYTKTQARRHEVLPGLTGWAQVHGRNAVSWDEKFRLDVWYVDHRSMLVDLHILALTALRLVRPQGVSSAGQATTTEFMGSVVKSNGSAHVAHLP